MTCLEVQGLITPFINNKLNIKQLDEFLNHINHCEACKEDLEVYYILLTGMKQLDDDKNLSGNFHLDFENLLRRSEEKVIKVKLNYIRKRIILFFMIIIISIVSSISVGEIVKDEIKENNISVSRYIVVEDFYGQLNTKLKDVMYKEFTKILENKEKEAKKERVKKNERKISTN